MVSPKRTDSPTRSRLLTPSAPLWAVTAMASAAQLMIVLDERVVNIALPSIRDDLGASAEILQWVITAYLVTFGGMLLPAARLNDLIGHRRTLIGGLTLFTAASMVAGLAPNGITLVAARFAQGIGAALLAPAGISLIAAVHGDPAARRRAMGVWGMVTSAGAVTGVVLGGVLTSILGWRSVMFINVPFGILLIIATLLLLAPAPRFHRDRGRLDATGALLATVGIAALAYGITGGPGEGWTSPRVIGSLAAAMLLLVAFVIVEAKSPSPLLPLGIFRLNTVRRANLGLLAFGAVLTTSLYLLSLSLQTVRHDTPLDAGLALVPMSALLGIGSILAPRLMAAGIRHLPLYGSLLASIGLAWLAFLPASGPYATTVLPPTLVIGAGFGVILVPLTAAAMTGVDASRLGTASGLLNVSRQIGGAVGLAVIVSIVTAVTGSGTAEPSLLGYRIGFGLSAAAGIITAVAVGRLHTDHHGNTPHHNGGKA